MQCAVAMSYAAAIAVRTADPVELQGPRWSSVIPNFWILYGGIWCELYIKQTNNSSSFCTFRRSCTVTSRETSPFIRKQLSIQAMVLIFCVEFRELSHLTCDLSQAKKEITVLYKLTI